MRHSASRMQTRSEPDRSLEIRAFCFGRVDVDGLRSGAVSASRRAMKRHFAEPGSGRGRLRFQLCQPGEGVPAMAAAHLWRRLQRSAHRRPLRVTEEAALLGFIQLHAAGARWLACPHARDGSGDRRRGAARAAVGAAVHAGDASGGLVKSRFQISFAMSCPMGCPMGFPIGFCEKRPSGRPGRPSSCVVVEVCHAAPARI